MMRVPHRIETPRLVLRCRAPEDAAALHAAVEANREHLKPFMPWAHTVESLEGTLARSLQARAAFDRGEDFVFSVVDRASGAIIGSGGLHPHGVFAGGLKIGYWIHVDQLRRGLATEVTSALTRAAFEVTEVSWMEIHVAKENVASAGVPPKAGYAHEATLRGRLLMGSGLRADSLVFSLFPHEYEASPARKLPVRFFDAAGTEIAARPV